MKSERGNVLPLALTLLLVLSILLATMLRLPGPLRRTVTIVSKETQEMYFAESAVLARLEGLPEGYFAGLPAIEPHILGPWTEWRTVRFADGRVNKFQFLLGNDFAHFSTSEWARCAVALEKNLHELVLQTDGLKNLSGNRRFFKLDPSVTRGDSPTLALNVNAGNLTLDLGGVGPFGDLSVHPHIHSFMANVEGDVKIRGYVHFDSLRIYSTGTVTMQGNVDVGYAEIFGLSGVTVADDVSLSGVLLSKQNIEVSGRAQVRFPSIAIAVGYRGNSLMLHGKSVFEGLAIAPSGMVERDSSVILADSSKTVLPFCMDSRKVVLDRRRL